MSKMLGSWHEGPLVEAEGLGYVYQTRDYEIVALRGLTIRMAEAEKIAIVGPSGCGKTTLMNILAGLDKPSSGWVRVGSFDLSQMSNREREEYRRSIVGYVWQHSHVGLFPSLSVIENVQVPMLATSNRKKEAIRKSLALLEAMRLSHRVEDKLYRLTYMQRQRLAIAVSLANDPLLLLTDEVTASMDDTAAFQLLEDLTEVLQSRGTAAIMVTHDQRLESYVDRVLHMDELRAMASASGGRQQIMGQEPRGYLGN